MKNYYNLDFDTLKTEIQEFMQNNTSFTDYNFEGSGASQIIDVLAYVTQYPAFYLSQILNEFFMKTNQIEDNVYKLAHQLNYLPSRKSAAYLVAQFQRTSNVTIMIPKFTKFTMGEVTLTNIEDITISTDDIQDITLYEGMPTEETFISDGGVEQVYDLENRQTIDNDYFYVFVDVPDGSGGWVSGVIPWVNVNKESFDTFDNGFYSRYFDIFSIAFDSGSIFNKPNEDDRVRVVYINTSGVDGNGLSGDISLTVPDDITHSEYLTITNTDTTVNGVDEETIIEIKARAPLFYATQNRAVTESDHNIIAKRYSKYNTFAGSVLWGGEKEFVDVDGNFDDCSVDKDLGHVYVTAFKNDMAFLNTTEINDYITFLNKQKFMTIFFKYIKSNIIKIIPTANISYKSVMDSTDADIQIQINSFLDDFKGYGNTFHMSSLIAYINSFNDVVYNYCTFITKVTGKLSNPKIIRFNNAIIEGSISATIDSGAITDAGGIIYRDGAGIGTINYSTGFMKLVYDFVDTDFEISFTYVDKEKITIERENYLFLNNIVVNPI
jgi:hypothetical protein